MAPRLTKAVRAAHRYRPGQAPSGFAAESSGSSSEDEGEQQSQRGSGEDEELDEVRVQRKRAEAAEEREKERLKKQGLSVRKEAIPLPVKSAKGKERASESEESEESEEEASKKSALPGGSEDESSSEEESSEEEEQPKIIYKPVFVSKRNRDTVPQRAVLNEDEEELERQSKLEEQRKQSHQLINMAVQRELADKEAAEIQPDVDDTDGLDDEAEFEAWKLRELTRIKRDTEAIYAREKEKEELDARRALPEALRLKEDTEYAAATRANKNQGSQTFLQKYHHKGAFYTDSDIMSKYDFTAPTESEAARDVSSLPKIMQKRNYGKMSQTKYTHLKDEDTTNYEAGWANDITRQPGRGGKPRDHNGDPGGYKRPADSAGPTGSNATEPSSKRYRSDY